MTASKPKRAGSSTPSAATGSFSLLNFFRRGSADTSTTQQQRKGKEKDKAGSSADPVVISDDDADDDSVSRSRAAPNKRRKVAESPARRASSRSDDEEVVCLGLLGDADESLGSTSSTCKGKGKANDTLPCQRDIDLDSPGPSKRARSSTLDGSLSACLVCNAPLGGLSPPAVQSHVNACLDDSQAVARKPTPARKRAPAAPTAPRAITSFTPFLPPRNTPPPQPAASAAPNAFSVLMNGNKDNEQWKDAETSETRSGGRGGPRKAPFYKVLTGMPIAVDAFCYGAIPGVTAYFLTHAHSDHYTSLSKSWRHGKIYCSKTTGNLIVHMLGVDPKWVMGLDNDEVYTVPETGGVQVTLMDANHCPGSSVFLFEGPQTINAGDSPIKSPFVGSTRVFRYLHCGDFRACPKHVLHPAVARAKVDTVYLDTTYLNPQYCFPPQPLVIEACAALARRAVGGAELPTESTAEEGEDDGVVDEPETEDIKPEIDCDGGESYVEGELDVKPDRDPNVKSDVKPDLYPDLKLDIKSDVKPALHPAEAAFWAQERSATMMEGWLVKKESANGEHAPKPAGRTVVLIGTYSIGKERIAKGVARAIGSRIYCDPRKRGILNCLDDPELHAILDDDPTKCQVHLVPLNNISLERIQPYLAALKPHFDRALGLRPTGWTFRPPAGTHSAPDVNMVIKRDQARGFSDVSLKPIRGSSREIMMFGVPYSEHSSFFELTCLALSLPGPVKMIATVNVHSEQSRIKMRKWFEKWEAEKGRRKQRGDPVVVAYRDETYW